MSTAKENEPRGIRAVARVAGVSIGTVSNVLNRPERVAPETLRRVHAAMRSTGFVANRGAASLRKGRNTTIGLIVPDIKNLLFAEVAHGAMEMADRHGYVIMLATSQGAAERQLRYVETIEGQRVAGLLMTPVGSAAPVVKHARERGIPVVVIDDGTPRNTCSVAVDDEFGAQLALGHLFAGTDRRVAVVNGPQRIGQFARRRRGAHAAAASAGRELVEEFVPDVTVFDGAAAAERLLAAHGPIDVFCTSDLLAIGVALSFRSAGLQLGRDVQLIGYDDIDLVAESHLSLSTVRRPKAELGSAAVELVLREVGPHADHHHENRVLTPSLVLRGSTRPARSG